MLEACGIIFALMWQLVKVFFILWISIFVPLLLFIALTRFVFAVVGFGWKEAGSRAKEALDGLIGRR